MLLPVCACVCVDGYLCADLLRVALCMCVECRFTKLALALAIAALLLAVAVDAKQKDDKETATHTVSHTTTKLTAAPRAVSKEAPPAKGPAPATTRASPQVHREGE